MADKTDFMAQAKAQMAAWSDEMTKMQTKMMEAGQKGQADMMKQIDALNEQRKHAEAQMEELGKANLDAAQEIQATMQKAWSDMEAQMKDLQKKMMG